MAAKRAATKRITGFARGLDFLTTITAKQRITIPAKNFSVLEEDFDDMVNFVGASLRPAYGNADTIMERLDDVTFGKPVRTRLVAFSNVSAAPIRLVFRESGPKYFDLYVTLSPSTESPGETIYKTEDGQSGIFDSKVSLLPLFELRPLGGGTSFFVDTGITPVPGFPMRLGTTGGRWTLKAPSALAVRSFSGTTLYYEGEVIIKAEGGLVAACCKGLAEFISTTNPGQFARSNFPNPREDANLELNRWSK